MSQARSAALEYAKLPSIERAAMAGRLMRKTWFAYVYMPDRYEDLLKQRLCARPEQIPAWVYADIEDKSRIPLPFSDSGLNDVRTQIEMGGRGAGKTRSATGWWVPELLERPGYRLSVLGPDFKVSRDVGIKGRSGIKTLIEALDPTLITKFDEVKNVLHLANGSQVFCYSTEYPKSIEGPEFHGFWGDEPAEWHGVGGDNCVYRKRVEPGIRLTGDNGEPIRKIITGTPETTDLIVELNKKAEQNPKRYAWSTLSTRANVGNIDEATVDQLYEEGSEEFVQAKLEGILLLESSHALIPESVFSTIRLDASDERHASPEQMDVVRMAVDANHSDDKKSDECGIIIGGRLRARAHIFADASVPGGPKHWGEQIVEALIAFPEIDEVVVEDDKSLVLEVVEGVLKENAERIGRIVKIRPIQHGNKSKKARADPVAIEYHFKRVYHDPSPRRPDWNLRKYEQQWKSWNPKAKGGKSPDRVDAGVYIVTDLLLRERTPDSFFKASDVTW